MAPDGLLNRRTARSLLCALVFFFLQVPFLGFAQIPAGSALDEWRKLEQTRINRTVDENKILAPSIRQQKKLYRPESETWFPLKAIWLSENELHVATNAGLPPSLNSLFSQTVDGKRQYRLLIHPESEQFYAPLMRGKRVDATTFRATSTSSSRTVLVRADTGDLFFAKLSLDVNLGKVRRTIPQGEVARSVGTDIYLNELEKTVGTSRFSHIHEPLGIIPKGWERGGMILRTVPQSVELNNVRLIPLFSLYAPDATGKTLLQDLAAKMNLSPVEYVRKHILEPFYDGWAQWALYGNTVMEAHAQNVLLETSPDGIPTGRFVHRDLGGFSIDLSAIPAESRAQLPTFSTQEIDYHQKFVGAARRESLGTYFDGGFLFNIDKELKRIQPGYRKGDIFREARQTLASTLALHSGASVSPLQVTPARIAGTLKRAQANFKAMTESCPLSYARLSRGF